MTDDEKYAEVVKRVGPGNGRVNVSNASGWSAADHERVALVLADREDGPEPPKPTRRVRCGFGGTPRCSTFLDAPGLCPVHRAAVRAAIENITAAPAADDDVTALADAIVAYLRTQDAWPVTRRAIAEVVDLGHMSPRLTAALKIVAGRGYMVVAGHAPARHRGVWPAGTELPEAKTRPPARWSREELADLIVDYVRQHPGSGQADVIAALGVSSSRTAGRAVALAKEQGRLTVEGRKYRVTGATA